MESVLEGDTVYALARRLDTALRDRVLSRAELRVPAHATADLAGLTVLANVTHGKHLLTRLSGELTLHTHLLMSGSWTVSDTGRWLPKAVMPDVRVVLRTDGPAAYGVKVPIVELLRMRDESTWSRSCCVDVCRRFGVVARDAPRPADT